ncbi:MAG TPA: transposase zinc-binding domain-containing protein [Methylomirabilota bacterium]|nr:transposase zinc-binding domain-containing protein [Methylomirabilota bacterium]
MALIRKHLEPFLREASDRGDGHGLPRFVEQEFREFLTCGVLAHGFARLRCADWTFERLVPFSCKRRGICPSCGGRRKAERAASLVDEMLPQVPVRQCVLTLPYRLRYPPGAAPRAAVSENGLYVELTGFVDTVPLWGEDCRSRSLGSSELQRVTARPALT